MALKFLPDRLLRDGSSLARFHREVRIARQVSHKNVCRVYDIGEVESDHFLSMEFIKGEELSSLLRRIGRLPSDKALQIARQICAGLAAAHDSGVLHRDLKPSNVMIDADGNARILDFGIAGLAEDFQDHELSAGTPAYMAPEQLEGSVVTARSDIYSLGLVLYELFTGKRAFEAKSLNELINLRRSDTTPTTPTSIVKDLDPVIEGVIDRCIQRDPSQRPSSALHVSAALPGGDPIAAALAAGETPSPEMVAAAPKVGTLRPAVALALLGGVIFLLLVPMLLSKRVATHRLIPLEKPPEVLKQEASEVAKTLGYTSVPADFAYGFDGDREYYGYLVEHRLTLNPWEVLKHAQPGLIRFWYRQSPVLLVPYNAQFVNMGDPPNEVPGMVLMSIDTEGKLFYFEAVPDQVSRTKSQIVDPGGPVPNPTGSRPPVAATSSVDPQFARLFRAAGLDIAKFQPVESEWTPPQAYDVRQAWSGVYPNLPQLPIRVEAAAYQGRPVYFQIVSPWTKPALDSESHIGGQNISTWLLLAVFFVTLLVGSLLALKNLRLGRGDRSGAFRVALFLFLIRMVHWAVTTHHVAESSELMLLVTGLQSSLFWGCFAGVLYLALEPYLRRRWPQRIISWSRLLAGDVRDPLVGRDILIGAFIGSLCVTLMYLRLAMPRWFGFDPGMPDVSDIFDTSMTGLTTFAGLFINQLSAAIVQTFMIVFLLLFLTLLLRKDWLGISIGFLILLSLFAIGLSGQEHIIAVGCVALAVACLVFCAVRFGPLALISALVSMHLFVFFPITTEFTAWYATTFILDLAILLGLALYGYYISLGGQSPFNVNLLSED